MPVYKKIDHEEISRWLKVYPQEYAHKTLVLFDTIRDFGGQFLVDEAVCKFLYSYIHLAVLTTLTEKVEDMEPSEQVKYIEENYDHLKQCIEEAVENAFTNAVSTFKSTNINFYCNIEIMPEKVN